MSQQQPSPARGAFSRVLTALLFGGVAALGLVPTGARAGGDCGCPPPYVHYQERPPRLKFKCACPQPVCPPYCAEFWGYYPTCWRQWPANQANCPERCPAWVAGAPGGALMPGARPAGEMGAPLGPMPPASSAPEMGEPAPAPMPQSGLQDSPRATPGTGASRTRIDWNPAPRPQLEPPMPAPVVTAPAHPG
jgi:hypothetical protein